MNKRKMKRLLALVLSFTMIFSMSMTVFASDITDPTGVESGEGEGEITNVDMSPQFKVSLPTATNFDFIVDPLGLLAMGEDATLTIAELLNNDRNADTGKVVFKHANAATNGVLTTTALNNSSVNIQLGVEYMLTGDATVLTAANVGWDTPGGETTDVFFQIGAPEDEVITKAEGETFTPHTNSRDAIRATARHYDYIIPAANYAVTRVGNTTAWTYGQVPNDSGNESGTKGVRFGFEGAVNKHAYQEWSDFAKEGKEIGLNVRYAFREATTAATAGVEDVTHLEGIRATAISWATPPPPPEASATATLSGNNGTIVIAATNFTFAEGATYAVQGKREGGTLATINIANIGITRNNANQLTVVLPTGWQTNQASPSWTELVVEEVGGHTVTMTKATAVATTVDTVTVTEP